MKKKFIIFSVLALGISSFALAGCKAQEIYEGEYVYSTDYGKYGTKVKVYVRGDVIDKVEIAETDYPRVTNEWEGSAVYYAGEQALLDSFSGKKVSEVKSYSVIRNGDVPQSINAEGIAVVTGATQSTGRLILAVQTALAKF